MFVCIAKWGFPGDAMINNPPANTRDSEMWAPSLGGEDLLEQEMATPSGILAWKIPWTEEPGWATVHGIAKSWTH